MLRPGGGSGAPADDVDAVETARRHLERGDLTVDLVDEGEILARCAGENLGFNVEGGWWCSCSRPGLCSHLAALLLVTEIPRGDDETAETWAGTALPYEEEERESRGMVLTGALIVLLALLGLALVGGAFGLGYWLGGRASETEEQLAGDLQAAHRRESDLRSELAVALSDLQDTRGAVAVVRAELADAEARITDLQTRLEQTQADLREAREAQGGTPGTFLFEYRVKPGDTLWELAGLFYDNNFRWPELLQANQGLEPTQMAIGSTVIVPLRNS